MAYRAKYGPLSMQMRSEWYIAKQMHQLTLINGGKAEVEDFLTFTLSESESGEDDDEATIDDVFDMLDASSRSGRK